jgi:hypothetical protein
MRGTYCRITEGQKGEGIGWGVIELIAESRNLQNNEKK